MLITDVLDSPAGRGAGDNVLGNTMMRRASSATRIPMGTSPAVIPPLITTITLPQNSASRACTAIPEERNVTIISCPGSSIAGKFTGDPSELRVLLRVSQPCTLLQSTPGRLGQAGSPIVSS
jgi:hypothetical protein